MKIFLLALTSMLATSKGAETSLLRRAAVVEGGNGIAVSDAFAKLYINELAKNPFHKNDEVKAYHSTYNIPGKWKGCGEIMGGGVSNTLDQEDILCCANTAGCGTQTSQRWERGCEVWTVQCDCDDWADATFEECSGLAPIDTEPVEEPGDETFNP